MPPTFLGLVPTSDSDLLPDQSMVVAIELNLSEAAEPSRVTAAIQTTAMSATRRAYSTRLAPRSVLAYARAQAAMNW